MQCERLAQPFDSPGFTLLILDRSVDVAPLFVHEYTYQVRGESILNVLKKDKLFWFGRRDLLFLLFLVQGVAAMIE